MGWAGAFGEKHPLRKTQPALLFEPHKKAKEAFLPQGGAKGFETGVKGLEVHRLGEEGQHQGLEAPRSHMEESTLDPDRPI